MLEAMSAEDPDRITLWLAHHEGDLVAATIAVRVGTHAWYSYGASSTEKRDVRGSNAVQWAMMRDALAPGPPSTTSAGITDTLDPDDPHAGLIQFKVGTGGEAVEYVGEWDLPLRPLLYRGVPARHEPARGPDVLTLTVDGDRWRRHLRAVADGTSPGWCRWPRATATASVWAGWPARAAWLGATPSRSAPTPSCPRWRPLPGRPAGADAVAALRAALEVPEALRRRVMHTVSRVDDLRDLLDRDSPRPVSCSSSSPACCATAWRRAGCAPPPLCSGLRPPRPRGIALHLPLASGSHLAEVHRLVDESSVRLPA